MFIKMFQKKIKLLGLIAGSLFFNVLNSIIHYWK